MFRKMYYTSEIMNATLIAAAVIVVFFIFNGIGNEMETPSLIVQSIIIFVLYFIVFFIAFFALINPFYDFLKGEWNAMLATITLLAIANVVLVIGMYAESSRTILDVILTNAGLFLATNIAIIYFGWKKATVEVPKK